MHIIEFIIIFALNDVKSNDMLLAINANATQCNADKDN